MNAPTTTFRSILEKPLNQLTEDDISQLTREDCRKYLKEKGMRRPSWNKSQAIQQVISLKALLEPNDDSGAGALRKIVVLPHTTTATTQRVSTFAASNSADSAKEVSPDVQASVSADELAPHPRNEPPKPAPEDPPVYADTTAISLRDIWICRHGQSCTLQQGPTICFWTINLVVLQQQDPYIANFRLQAIKMAFSFLVQQFLRQCKQVTLQRRLVNIHSSTGRKGTTLVILMQRVRRTEKSRCRDTVKSEKTGHIPQMVIQVSMAQALHPNLSCYRQLKISQGSAVFLLT
ncbi:uncharacterized protein LOC126595918 isoform X13 [Malus sylvestris]|uniref:uncharacterized protein LOC126595918 isoform X13 n=1 Tax=Malus sylvestris TaxID=3752 RepID=UPI0021ACF6CA|nr:uncharacterized protein LOC126595918 isoform X13 [Malus sylvestris]